MGSPTSFLSYEHLKSKIKGASDWFCRYQGKIMNESCLAIKYASNDIMLMTFSDTRWYYHSIKGQGL